MKDIIGILLYNNFIELPESNQTFGEKQGVFKLPRARQAGRKEHAKPARTCECLRRNQKKTTSLYKTASHMKDIFAILLLSSLISEMCSLLLNYGKRKAPLGLCEQ